MDNEFAMLRRNLFTSQENQRDMVIENSPIKSNNKTMAELDFKSKKLLSFDKPCID